MNTGGEKDRRISTVAGVLESIMSSKPQYASAEAWEAPIVALLRAEESKHLPKDEPDRSAAADVS